MALTQAERAIEIFTPLGEDVLLFHRMTATEELGRLFQIDLDLLSKDPDIKFEDLLGQNVTIRIELPQDKTRYFNGFVSRFSLSGSLGELSVYNVIVRPWLWFLTRTADCRIFQEMTVPDIIKQVFRDQGFTDFEEALSGSYRKWTYCVQYRETDFNFVSRLMEQEGIYYYFKHEKNKHSLVLSDSVSSHEPFPGYEKIPFFPPDEHLRREEHHIHEWTVTQEVQPGIYALDDFDFERPRANLQVKSSVPRSHVRSKMEIFDYPGEYTQTGDGETYARARIEELHSEYELVQGQSNARGLSVGSLFELVDFPRQDQNREYLVVNANYELDSDAYTTGLTAEVEDVYTCGFTALDSKQPYRPPRTTPKPMVQGPQTAVVVGPSGEKIYTDKYGRVKVQFHWDRYGKNDENSSCWIRVSQAWAGANWGGMHIPHVGQEVIVDFIEGDPDRPIITGRVYNANNMPPKKLPDGKQMSIVRDQYGNELVFDATPGDEHIEIYSPHHESRFILGRSTEKFSMGDNRDMVLGNSYTDRRGSDINLVNGPSFTWTRGFSLGVKEGGHASFQVGTDIGFFGGFKFGVNIGTKMDLGLGANVFVGRSTQWNCNWAEYTRATKKDLTLYSSKEAWLCGGENNGIVKCSEGAVSLSFGKGKPKTDYWDVTTKYAAAGSALGAIGTTLTGAFRGLTDIEKAHAHVEYKYDDKLGRPVGWKVDPKKVANDISPGFAESVSLAATLAGALVSTLGKDQDPEQESVNSRIELNIDGVSIFSGSEKADDAQAKIEILKDGCIKITAEKGINIVSKDDIKLTTEEKWIELDSRSGASIRGDTLSVKAAINHTNFEVKN